MEVYNELIKLRTVGDSIGEAIAPLYYKGK